MATYGNTSASSLLRQAQATYKRNQEYNDAIASYEFYKSAATPEDFQKYSDYLQGRVKSLQSSDPSKALSMQRTLDESYRRFNSAEISRATLAVNYGESDNRGKYTKIMGLYEASIQNGDDALASRLESNLASLSITIQNEDAAKLAASGRGGGGRGGSGGSAYTAISTKINELEAKVDRAFQTGQPIVDNGVATYIDGKAYAMNQAQILKARHDILSAQAASDPKYGDDLARLEKLADYRNLIDSGLVQFDANGQPIASSELDNLAITFKKDAHTGVMSRDYKYVDPVNGNVQYGIIKPELGSDKNGYVVQHVLSDSPGTPSARVYYETGQAKDPQGNDIKDTQIYNDPLGFSRGKMVGSQVLVNSAPDPNKYTDAAGKKHSNQGRRAIMYNDKNGGQVTQEQAAGDLQNLINPYVYKPGTIDLLLEKAQALKEKYLGTKDASSIAGGIRGVGNIFTKTLGAFTNPGRALTDISRFNDKAVQKKKTDEANRLAAEQQRRTAEDLARRAAAFTPNPANIVAAKAKPSVMWRPPKPIKVPNLYAIGFTNKTGTTQQKVASGIGEVAGYNKLLKGIGLFK